MSEELEHLRRVVEAVEALHREAPNDPGWCEDCGSDWPCDTIAVLRTGAMPCDSPPVSGVAGNP